MKNLNNTTSGRYLLFLDILGFSERVKTENAIDIHAVIDQALKEFSRWEELNKLFRTIYFSDTFIFYQHPKGYGNWAFLDVYAIGSMVLSALLAKGIPARGAISFGEFEVNLDHSEKHQIYFGQALIEAYHAEQKENWIGITILKSAWLPYEQNNPGSVASFESEKVWIKRINDEVILLNPFIKLRGWPSDFIDMKKPYSQWDAPEFQNEILAFKYLRSSADNYIKNGDFSSKLAAKYHATILFLQVMLGVDLYNWAITMTNEIDSK